MGHPLTSALPSGRDERFEELVWRQEQIEAAFEHLYKNKHRELAAKIAAEPTADLHVVVKAILNGCPVDLVREIFL